MNTPQALHGVRVLDFTQLLQGPYATQMLGDMGADVIKIEKAGNGDLYRSMTFFDQWMEGGESPCFLAWNRNKRSLAVDLKDPEGRRIVRELARSADIVIENFRPGVMERLGFGYEALRKENPEIIYCSATGWGSGGPYAGRPGQDLLVQSLTGVTLTSGKADDRPIAVGTALSDQLGALHIVYSVLAALYYRERTGTGQLIEANLMQSVLAFQMQDLFAIQNLGREFQRPRSGIAHPGNAAPFGIYPTSDGYLAIAMNPWPKVVEGLETPDLMKYNDPRVLFEERDRIYEEIAAITVTRPTAEWLEKMLALDLWVAEVKSQAEVADDPQARHLGAFKSLEHPKAGEIRVTDIPFRMSETPGQLRSAPPLVGQHGPEILREELGFSEEEIARLREAGIITVEEAE